MYGKNKKVKIGENWYEQNGRNGTKRPKCSVEKYEQTLTSQSYKDECDINKIMAKIEKGQMVDRLVRDGRFDDVSEFEGLAEALIKVQEANDAFMNLSAEVRARFENDPVKLVEFLEDGENRKEAEELGLVQPKPIQESEPETIPPAAEQKAQ